MLVEFIKQRGQKMFPLVIVLFILLAFLPSCKTFILKSLYGIKKPKVESERSILKYASKKGLLQDNIFTLTQDDWTWAVQNISFAKSIPDIMVFDKNGNLLKYREESQCNAKAFSFLSSLTKENKFEYDSLLTMKDLTTKLKDLKGNNTSFTINDSTDYYVFIFWAVWIGRLNKDNVKEWETDALNNKNCSIKVIKVNMDKQEWWDKKH